MYKSLFLKTLTLFVLLILPFSVLHAESNSGFLNDTIWYSEKTFSEGDTIEIHTAVWNAEDSVLNAKVDFTDGTTLLGSRSISVPVHTLNDVFITWKVTAGDHTIKATIKNATITTNGKATPITFTDFEQVLPKISITKKVQGTSSDEVTKSITDTVDKTLPENVAKPISKGINSLDSFRVNTEVKIEGLLENTNKRIESLNNATPTPATATPTKDTTTSKKPVDTKNPTKTTDTKEPVVQKKSALSGTEKPIAYVELFLLNVASFIFKSAVAFYLVCAFLLFIIIRFIYKKIKG